MKDTFYFSHDQNARCDEKSILLVRSLGWEGYGLYWALVEKLYEAEGRLTADYETIAYDLRTGGDKIKSLTNDFGLFYLTSSTPSYIGSRSVDRRLQERKEKSDAARQAAFARHHGNHAVAMRSHPMRNAINKGKERKETNIDACFDAFYSAYPRKVARGAALKAWNRLKPDKDLLARILSALEVQKKSDQWKDPQYIPYPATWLNQERWDDSIQTQTNQKETKNRMLYA